MAVASAQAWHRAGGCRAHERGLRSFAEMSTGPGVKCQHRHHPATRREQAAETSPSSVSPCANRGQSQWLLHQPGGNNLQVSAHSTSGTRLCVCECWPPWLAWSLPDVKAETAPWPLRRDAQWCKEAAPPECAGPAGSALSDSVSTPPRPGACGIFPEQRGW